MRLPGDPAILRATQGWEICLVLDEATLAWVADVPGTVRRQTSRTSKSFPSRIRRSLSSPNHCKKNQAYLERISKIETKMQQRAFESWSFAFTSCFQLLKKKTTPHHPCRPSIFHPNWFICVETAILSRLFWLCNIIIEAPSGCFCRSWKKNPSNSSWTFSIGSSFVIPSFIARYCIEDF